MNIQHLLRSVTIHTILCALVVALSSGCNDFSRKHQRASLRSLTNAKEIFKYCYLYAEKNQGNFPDSWKNELFLKQIKSDPKKLFISPSTGEGFVYISGYTLSDPLNRILIYTTKPKNFKGRHVIYLDGGGDWLSEERFQSEMSKQEIAKNPKLKILSPWSE